MSFPETMEALLWQQFDQLKMETETVFVNDTYICPCGGVKLFSHGDLPVCTTCGRVDDYFLSEDAEWASGIDNDGEVTDGSRVGAPVDLDLFSDKWGSGCMISTIHQSTAVKKMARISFHSSMNHKDRALFHAYAEFDRVKVKLGISDAIIRIAKVKYREITEKQLTRGAVRTGVKANCVLNACKEMNVPRTTKEIADAFNISTHDMGRTSAVVATDVNECKVTMPRDVVNRILNKLDLGDDLKSVRRKIYHLCDAAAECPKLMGKTPNGVASAIIFTVFSQEGISSRITKQMICEVSDVSVPTLNKIEAILKQEIH